jgi:hypothetical protein
MSVVTEQIINKLRRLEELSEPTLDSILNFVCLVETHLTQKFNRETQAQQISLDL